ncbi:MGH1-like glycoside hydrolase domain-containing protein [Mycolicibacterium komossense]|uniref:Glucosidase n=1 Tax=Mycolicibacterium komossense TaxID=1779 RepID=A0ABT3CHA6_9MYCO|nr:glucosidase [Mycolicibacterium komossense]MCV7228860.1 glucosidase [Mycolicibacterium komossense]
MKHRTAEQVGAERGRVDSFGRLDQGLRHASDWYLWGPYLSERQWGTVREDYSADGDAWNYLPHDHARSVAYRWGEDGLAGFCDIEQRLCLALALWNGNDPILKERAFGVNSYEGNHGEDVKEYWWYLDALPSHASNRWRYHYPQKSYPYQKLLQENQSRGKDQPEYELLDTGVFDDDRYWVVDVDYAKADPTDILMTVTVTNAGPDTATLHVLPTLWYRNTWSWGEPTDAPTISGTPEGAVTTTHPFLGDLELLCGPAPDGDQPQLLFCDNVTNVARLYNQDPLSRYPADGINDHVVTGAATVNPAMTGSKCAMWYQLSVKSGQSVELRLRLRPAGVTQAGALGDDFTDISAERKADADEFYAELTPPAASADEAAVMRQAFAGMLWSKQLYYYDVARWLDGDPGQPAPPPQRQFIRNDRWRNFQAFDVMSMPDTWEYPWFAAWDLAFQCVALAHVDPAFAKYQLSLLCREWFQHPNGALPSYEWNFSDLNPPVQAWAALEVFAIDNGRDMDFLSRIFDKLLVNFTWWINREDADGSNLFEGGFLGLDNIGPLNRSELPFEGILEQSDATGWMATYALAMAQIAAILHGTGYRPALDLVQKFVEHFALIADALDTVGVWDEADGMFYDRIVLPDGTVIPVRVHSMVAMIPLLATAVIDEDVLEQSLAVGKRFADYLRRRGLADTEKTDTEVLRLQDGQQRLLLGVIGMDRVRRMMSTLFDPAEFLSPHGLRSLSAYHREHPYVLNVNGLQAGIDYEPAESTTGMFGGNSNWRGPVWFPLNFLVASALERFYHFCGQELVIEYPTGSGNEVTLDVVADDLRGRLVSLFLVGADGNRPCFGASQRMQTDPRWRDNLLFHEYFNGDNGTGLGASHQTGWTGLVADVIRRRHGAVPPMSEVFSEVMASRRNRSD